VEAIVGAGDDFAALSSTRCAADTDPIKLSADAKAFEAISSSLSRAMIVIECFNELLGVSERDCSDRVGA
jgi:hypothetical protein